MKEQEKVIQVENQPQVENATVDKKNKKRVIKLLPVEEVKKRRSISIN